MAGGRGGLGAEESVEPTASNHALRSQDPDDSNCTCDQDHPRQGGCVVGGRGGIGGGNPPSQFRTVQIIVLSSNAAREDARQVGVEV